MGAREFQNRIGYHFREVDLLRNALTHSSYCRENGLPPGKSNERLEYLGDAFLDAVISEYLYCHMPKKAEGSLTKIRASVVCERSLAEVADNLFLGQELCLGKGELRCGGNQKPSILADAVEAVIGAIFLDGGYECAKTFILNSFSDIIRDAVDGKRYTDYKTQVQEILQKGGSAPEIRYVLDREAGADHNKTFYVHLCCNDRILGKGSGKSKKEAEQDAAKNSLDGGLV